MKKILLIIFLSTLTLNVHSETKPNWGFFIKTSGGKVYGNLDSIIYSGGFFRMELLYDYNKLFQELTLFNETEWKSMSQKIIINCKKKIYANKEIISYELPMGKGKSNKVTYEKLNWKPIPPPKTPIGIAFSQC